MNSVSVETNVAFGSATELRWSRDVRLSPVSDRIAASKRGGSGAYPDDATLLCAAASAAWRSSRPCGGPRFSSIECTALYRAVHCFNDFPGGVVSTGNLGGFFCDVFEFARRPGANCFYFCQSAFKFCMPNDTPQSNRPFAETGRSHATAPIRGY